MCGESCGAQIRKSCVGWKPQPTMDRLRPPKPPRWDARSPSLHASVSISRSSSSSLWQRPVTFRCLGFNRHRHTVIHASSFLNNEKGHCFAQCPKLGSTKLSSPRESHPEALPELYVSLSTHTA